MPQSFDGSKYVTKQTFFWMFGVCLTLWTAVYGGTIRIGFNMFQSHLGGQHKGAATLDKVEKIEDSFDAKIAQMLTVQAATQVEIAKLTANQTAIQANTAVLQEAVKVNQQTLQALVLQQAKGGG